ncbi:MAG: DMT family transporter [Acidimicrobiia bacterium]
MSAPAAVPEALAETGQGEGAFTPADWLVFVAISGIWGASFLFIAIGLDSLEPGVVTLMRVGLGAVTLAVLPGGRVRIEPADRARLVAVSILWVGIPFTLFPLAEQRINSAVTGLLNGATPMFAALFAATMFGRRTTGAQLLGVFVGFAGIVLISLPSLGEGSTEALGVGLVLLATVCYGLATNLVAPLQGRYGSQAVMGKMLALATIWTLPYGLVGLDGSRVEARPLVAVAVLGVVGTGLAFLLMGALVGRVGPTRATFITYCMPPVSLALGVVFQDDHVAALALVGVVLAIAGAVLAGRPVVARAAKPDPTDAPAVPGAA